MAWNLRDSSAAEIVTAAGSVMSDPEGVAEKQMKGEPNGWVREWHPPSRIGSRSSA